MPLSSFTAITNAVVTGNHQSTLRVTKHPMLTSACGFSLRSDLAPLTLGADVTTMAMVHLV